MIKLNYNKVTKKLFDFSNEERKHFGFINVEEEDRVEILKQLNNGFECFANPERLGFYFKKRFNECSERCKIVELRNSLLLEFDTYDKSRRKTTLVNEELTETIYENEMSVYYDFLLNLPQDFDSCEDKPNFSFEIVKPSFFI